MVAVTGTGADTGVRKERAGSMPSCCDSLDSHVHHAGDDDAADVEDGFEFLPLDYDYVLSDWYEQPATTRKDRWSEPYFDAGGGE